MNTTSRPSATNPAASSRELGLDVALIAARYFFKTDHLHYGYWPADLPVEISNLKQAQENHAELILATIPAGTRTILDVGMGTGTLAKRLVDAGYTVDCVSPSPYLTRQGRARLGDQHTIFECKYEDLETEKRYDLILFSESFQYIDLKKCLSLSERYLNGNGHLLICDFFRNDTKEPGPFGGGHNLTEFRSQMGRLPFHRILDRDITAQTSPNLDLVADCVEQVIQPIKERLFHFAGARYPLPFRALQWLFRRQLAMFDEKYFSGKRRGANFQIYKTYRLMLFAKGPQPKEVTA